MNNNDFFINILKAVTHTDTDLDKSQLKPIEIIRYTKRELDKMSDFALLEIQELWYLSVQENLRKYIKQEFLQKFKEPEDGFSSSVKSFKRTNKQILENLEKTIKKTPDAILLKHENSEDAILPKELFTNTRGYIENIADQINICYQNNCFDACSMCMRRLLEILLVLTYQNHDKSSEIINSDTGRNKVLSYIINYTQSNNQFHISKDVLDTMDKFKELGNFAAHKIQYNCYKTEIDKVKSSFRITIQELLYTAGIKK